MKYQLVNDTDSNAYDPKPAVRVERWYDRYTRSVRAKLAEQGFKEL